MYAELSFVVVANFPVSGELWLSVVYLKIEEHITTSPLMISEAELLGRESQSSLQLRVTCDKLVLNGMR